MVIREPSKTLKPEEEQGENGAPAQRAQTPRKVPQPHCCSAQDRDSSSPSAWRPKRDVLTSWGLITSLSTGQVGAAFNSLETKRKVNPKSGIDLEQPSILRLIKHLPLYTLLPLFTQYTQLLLLHLPEHTRDLKMPHSFTRTHSPLLATQAGF